MGDVVNGPWEPRPEWPVPAGRVNPADVRWRRGRPPEPARARRHCADCARPFSPTAWVPRDLICRDCRNEREQRAQDAAPATLFDGGDADT